MSRRSHNVWVPHCRSFFCIFASASHMVNLGYALSDKACHIMGYSIELTNNGIQWLLGYYLHIQSPMLLNVLFFKWDPSQVDIYFQEMDPIPSRSPGDTQKLGKLKELTQESNSFPWRCEGLAGFSWGSLVTHGIPRFSHQKKGSCFEHHSTDRSCLGQKTMVSWVSYKNIMAWSSNCGCSP